MNAMQTSEVLTGDAEWDRQHNLLHQSLMRLNGIVSAIAASVETRPTDKAEEEFLDILAEVLTLMVTHFRWEEGLMKSLPHTPLNEAHCSFHRDEHNAISDKLSELAAELDKKQLLEAVESLGEILTTWLSAHIRGYDQPFFRLLTANGWKPNLGNI